MLNVKDKIIFFDWALKRSIGGGVGFNCRAMSLFLAQVKDKLAFEGIFVIKFCLFFHEKAIKKFTVNSNLLFSVSS
jgi:hypothetical protein